MTSATFNGEIPPIPGFEEEEDDDDDDTAGISSEITDYDGKGPSDGGDDSSVPSIDIAALSASSDALEINNHNDERLACLQNNNITLGMKNKLLHSFGGYGWKKWKLIPLLNDTLITDQGAQTIMDIASSSSTTKEREWGKYFNVSGTSIGDSGVEALAKAFMATNAKYPSLRLSPQTSIDDAAAISLAVSLQKNSSWSELNLSDSAIGKEGLQALSLALQDNTEWERLDFSRTEKIADEEAMVLASALQQNKVWKELIFSRLKIGIQGVRALADAMIMNPSWSKMDLQYSGIGTKGTIALSEALCSSNKWESLDLRETFIGDDGATALASALQQNTNWRVLDLCRTDIGIDGAKALATALHGNANWQYLIIQLDYLGEKGMKIIARHLQQTKQWKRYVLHFPLLSNHDAAALSRLAQAIAQLQQPGFWVSLVLWFPGADEDVEFLLRFPDSNEDLMNALAQSLSKHHPLNTNSNIPNLFVTNETAENAMKMAEYLGQCWQEMDIFFFDTKCVYEKEDNAIVQVTRDFNFGRTMSLQNTQLSYQGAIILANALSLCHSWIRFAISFSQVGDEGAAALAHALAKNSWRCFDLSNTAIGNMGARKLGLALDGNGAWQVLSVASTAITDRGACSLSLALEGQEWHVLDYGFTQIGDRGFKSLSRALTDGESNIWRHLRLSNNSVSDVAATRLAQVLAGQSCWRIFDIGNLGITDDILQRMSSSLERNQCWEIVDFRHARLPISQATDNLDQITAANACWKVLQCSRQGQLVIALGPSEEALQLRAGTNEAINENTMVVAWNRALPHSPGPVDTNSMAVVPLQPMPIETRETCLELAVLHGLSKIKNLSTIENNFEELGTQLLDVADSMGGINQLCIEMAGGAGRELRMHPPKRLNEIKTLLSFGVELAMAMLHLVKEKAPKYDVFISFAGEDRKTNGQDYVGRLRDRILLSGLSVFVDRTAMRAGQTSYPLATMFTHVLTARVVVSVASIHYVQKKWPMAELLCGLARNMAAGLLGHSPLIMDTMPSCQWILDGDWTKNRHPGKWLNDLTVLLPTQLPSMQSYEGRFELSPCNPLVSVGWVKSVLTLVLNLAHYCLSGSASLSKHIQKVTMLAVDSCQCQRPSLGDAAAVSLKRPSPGPSMELMDQEPAKKRMSLWE
ncbi:hypothetical protein ACA910_003293 [Epithemia clementina (nom. ined.)]